MKDHNYVSIQPWGEIKKSQPKSTRIQTNMNERERGKPKSCSICKLVGHSKNRCLHHPENLDNSWKIDLLNYKCFIKLIFEVGEKIKKTEK